MSGDWHRCMSVFKYKTCKGDWTDMWTITYLKFEFHLHASGLSAVLNWLENVVAVNMPEEISWWNSLNSSMSYACDIQATSLKSDTNRNTSLPDQSGGILWWSDSMGRKRKVNWCCPGPLQGSIPHPYH